MSINIKTTGIHHVALRSTDMERSKRFYTGTLGFELALETPELFLFLAGGAVFGVRAPDAQNFARRPERQQTRAHGFERARVFGERAVVRDDGHVQTEFERERAGVAETPPRDERDAHARRTRTGNRARVALRHLAERVEQSSIEIEREQTNHKSSDK